MNDALTAGFRGTWSLFLKPWHQKSIEQQAEFAAGLGVSGVELPVRSGLQVSPENARQKLPEAQRVFAGHGLAIRSIAGPLEPELIGLCGELGIRDLRTMPAIGAQESYLEAEARWRKTYESLLPDLARNNVRLAVQQHAGDYISSAAGILRLIDGLPKEHVAAVWDPAHCAFSGESMRHSISILEGQLAFVNLKNGIWKPLPRKEGEGQRWNRYWTTGAEGLASWEDVAAELARRQWHGNVLHFAEYADASRVDDFTRADFDYMRRVFSEAYSP